MEFSIKINSMTRAFKSPYEWEMGETVESY